MASEVRALPLSLTTCLPLPLPATPVSNYREPDFHRMERNFFSAFDGKPFIPMEPQRVCYMTRSPKNIGEIFTAQYDRVWHLAKYKLQRAEFLKPTDPNQTPFQSVMYLKGERKGEVVPVMKEVAQVVNLKTVPEQLPRQSVSSKSSKSQKDCNLLETISNDCSSIYRAMGSSATSRSSQSQKTTSSRSSQSGYGSDNSADELVRLWNEFFVKDRKENQNKAKPTKESSSWEKSLSEEGAYRRNSNYYFPPGTKKYLTQNEAKFLEWKKEIGRLKEFLGDEEVKKIQKTASGKKTKKKRMAR